MTDEEKLAIEIVNNLDTEIYDCEGSCVSIYDHMKSACLAGIKASKPKWHDLRKNPDDLPEDDRQCLCFISTCYFVGYYDEEYDQEWHFDEFCTNKIDAWTELPKFEG